MTTIYVTIMVMVILSVSFVFFNKKENDNFQQKKRDYSKFKIFLEKEVDNIKSLSLAGVDDDGNTDYYFSEAVSRINLSEDIRVKIYE